MNPNESAIYGASNNIFDIADVSRIIAWVFEMSDSNNELFSSFKKSDIIELHKLSIEILNTIKIKDASLRRFDQLQLELFTVCLQTVDVATESAKTVLIRLISIHEELAVLENYSYDHVTVDILSKLATVITVHLYNDLKNSASISHTLGASLGEHIHRIYQILAIFMNGQSAKLINYNIGSILLRNKIKLFTLATQCLKDFKKINGVCSRTAHLICGTLSIIEFNQDSWVFNSKTLQTSLNSVSTGNISLLLSLLKSIGNCLSLFPTDFYQNASLYVYLSNLFDSLSLLLKRYKASACNDNNNEVILCLLTIVKFVASRTVSITVPVEMSYYSMRNFLFTSLEVISSYSMLQSLNLFGDSETFQSLETKFVSMLVNCDVNQLLHVDIETTSGTAIEFECDATNYNRLISIMSVYGALKRIETEHTDDLRKKHFLSNLLVYLRKSNFCEIEYSVLIFTARLMLMDSTELNTECLKQSITGIDASTSIADLVLRFHDIPQFAESVNGLKYSKSQLPKLSEHILKLHLFCQVLQTISPNEIDLMNNYISLSLSVILTMRSNILSHGCSSIDYNVNDIIWISFYTIQDVKVLLSTLMYSGRIDDQVT